LSGDSILIYLQSHCKYIITRIDNKPQKCDRHESLPEFMFNSVHEQQSIHCEAGKQQFQRASFPLLKISLFGGGGGILSRIDC